jgi:site-specific recombinase XerD
MERFRIEKRPRAQIPESEDVGCFIPTDELDRLLQACDDGTPKGIRDRAMFSIAI